MKLVLGRIYIASSYVNYVNLFFSLYQVAELYDLLSKFDSVANVVPDLVRIY